MTRKKQDEPVESHDPEVSPAAAEPAIDEPAAAKRDTGGGEAILHRVGGLVASTASGVARRFSQLSLHGVQVTRPLEIALRGLGIVVVVLAPFSPTFGSVEGWWSWLVVTVANVGIGIALFGAGEALGMIRDVHRAMVGDGGNDETREGKAHE